MNISAKIFNKILEKSNPSVDKNIDTPWTSGLYHGDAIQQENDFNKI